MSNDEDSWSLCIGSSTNIGSGWTIEFLHKFMFHPSSCEESEIRAEYLAPYLLIRPVSDEAQVSIARLQTNKLPLNNQVVDANMNQKNQKNQQKRCLLISHGNAGNIFDRIGLLDSLAHYPGDIFCYEYDGFGLLCHKSVSIPACRNNHLFWLDYLVKQGYQQIDLWGESIGGGIVMDTLDYLRQNDFSPAPDELLMPRINQVYLQSTFASIRSLLYSIGSVLYYLYAALFLNDLDTQSVLAKFHGSPIKFNILHSRTDEIIPYSEAQSNYAECIKNRVPTKLWNIGGSHNEVSGLEFIRFD